MNQNLQKSIKHMNFTIGYYLNFAALMPGSNLWNKGHASWLKKVLKVGSLGELNSRRK